MHLAQFSILINKIPYFGQICHKSIVTINSEIAQNSELIRLLAETSTFKQ